MGKSPKIARSFSSSCVSVVVRVSAGQFSLIDHGKVTQPPIRTLMTRGSVKVHIATSEYEPCGTKMSVSEPNREKKRSYERQQILRKCSKKQ